MDRWSCHSCWARLPTPAVVSHLASASVAYGPGQASTPPVVRTCCALSRQTGTVGGLGSSFSIEISRRACPCPSHRPPWPASSSVSSSPRPARQQRRPHRPRRRQPLHPSQPPRQPPPREPQLPRPNQPAHRPVPPRLHRWRPTARSWSPTRLRSRRKIPILRAVVLTSRRTPSFTPYTTRC